MSLLASAPGGLAVTGWRTLAAVSAGFCLAPAVLGALGLGAVLLAGPERLGEAFLPWHSTTTLAALSPLVTWPVWAVIGGGAGWLMRRGRYGALPALLLGAAAGGAAGALIDQPLGAPLGAVLATFHRFTLALLRPLAF
ncbi:hypothetical protein LHP98_11720 [Rhodobacter sp. Har01]|uniref:hypothetical protein n=1 Tax=Rhodobacter sp. Har01 TaxID=2883999 RepID=UPI001D0721DF|nr:hypothetical protein [Rhodobacter sp. Har01]MCB6178797.1 hypothetical protein [Rhodobacter sp. Har01]